MKSLSDIASKLYWESGVKSDLFGKPVKFPASKSTSAIIRFTRSYGGVGQLPPELLNLRGQGSAYGS